MSALIAGILAGSLHVLSGPDHLVAVAPLAMRRPTKAMIVGAFWGAGHAVGAAALGGIGMAARTLIEVDLLSAWAEFLVGGVLCGIGAWALFQARKLVVHRHEHKHDIEHEHVHAHLNEKHDDVSHHEAPNKAHATHHQTSSFGVGMLHGAAGTGHLLGVLPSLALPPVSAGIYLAAYGLSAVVAMTVFSGLIGAVGSRLPPAALRYFLMASGVAAIGLGVFWMIQGYPS